MMQEKLQKNFGTIQNHKPKGNRFPPIVNERNLSMKTVKEYGNGCIILEPREVEVPDSISTKTLEDMDRAMENFEKGTVSQVIHLPD